MLRNVALPLSRKQIASIVECTARINIWHGAIRSGKTIASLIALLAAVAGAPRAGLILITGRTLDTIGRNIMEPLVDPGLFGELSKLIIWTPGAKTAVILGRTVHLIGANDRRSEAKIRGATVSLVYCDEVSLLPKDFFRQLLGRLSVKGAKLMGTTNPDNPGHWLKKEYLDRAGELNLRSWHFNLDDNPSLDADYVASLKKEYVGLWYRRFILGAWVQSEGAVYEMFDPTRHVVKELPRIDRWLADGIDYGTVNPFADVLVGLGADRRLYVVSEYRHDSRLQRRQMTDAEYSRARRTWLAGVPHPHSTAVGVTPEWTVVDPSASSFIEQLHRDGVTGVTHADNAVLDGIRTVSSLLGTGDLLIHESATGLIEELPGYSWDDTAAEAGEDKPIKENDHSVDALRYGVRTTEALWRPYIPTRLEVAA
ncbi:PBSX family phage terminase large subunit [Streptomyces sp. AM 2-1-1]|uniref:PBSX family phage terminase large subunit n=1 Tax=Streptomyces sp. AM 2-1-1 TaxID=3028709 RepID=UPI0023B8CC1E|nr:PBSX family phage terminase large subunit [Streptomyces sp. AM 2-1-1]WEH40787.1 PBSX family phage terminase large subunit [Streptomyces sp. AM 2-1-1]